MKNKSKILHYVYLLMLSGTLLTACSKESTLVEPNMANGNTAVTIESIADNILTDSLFVNLVRDFDNEAKKIQLLNSDSQLVISSNELLMNSIVTFFINQRDYKNLNSVDKLKALNYISESVQSKTYLAAHPNIISLYKKDNSATIGDRIFSNANMDENKKVLRISDEEIIDCAIQTALAALGGYGEALNDIGILLRGGISTKLLINMGIDILKKASPWWKVATIVLTFTVCIYGK
jgi:hypothetical protein